MRTTSRRSLVAAAALASLAVPPIPGHASAGVTAIAADGRILSVGSVVAEGVRSGAHCAYADDGVTVVADDTTDSSITLTVDDDCRLVVTALGTVIPGSVSPGVRYTAPKVYDTSGSSPDRAGAGVGGQTGAGGSVLIAGAVEAAAAVAASDQVVVQVVQIIESESGVQEYRDYAGAQYVRNLRTRTVGGLEPYYGSCEGSYIDENVLYGPYANDILSCFYKETSNGPNKVGFIAGGTYRKSIATITIDQRKLTETYEATYYGPTKRGCDPGGALRTGWSATCYIDVN